MVHFHMNAHIFYHPRRIRVVRISVSCFLYAPVLAALCFQLVCPAVPLSVLVSVPSSNGLLTALAVCQPRRTCGWDHSCANVNSPAGGGVYSVQKWNSPQGGQVHYADAVAGGHQMATGGLYLYSLHYTANGLYGCSLLQHKPWL